MKLLLVLLLTISLFGASSDQLDKYMSLSSATEKVVLVESKLGKLEKIMGIEVEYDFAKVELRFKKKIAEELSNDEMKEILDNYNNLLYSRLIHEISRDDWDKTAAENLETYYNQTKDNKDQDGRLKIIEEITDNMIKDEMIGKIFTKISTPFMKISDDQALKRMEKSKKIYIKQVKYSTTKIINYRLQDLSIEDLKELAKFTKKSSVYNERKALSDATVYAIEEYVNIIVKTFKNKKEK